MKTKLLLLLSTLTFTAHAQFNEAVDKPELGHKFKYSIFVADHTGKPYVPYQLTTLDSKHINNENGLGKVTFINLWFMGCLGCRAEFDALNKLYSRFSKNKDFRLIAVTYDPAQDLPDFLNKYNIKYPVASTTKEECSRMLAVAYPTNIIIDKRGNVAYVNLGTISAVKNSIYGRTTMWVDSLVGALLNN